MGLNIGGKPKGLFPGPIVDASGVPLSDWKAITDQATIKRIEGTASNENKTFYTVPAGKKFYFLGGSFGYINTGAATAQVNLYRLGGDTIINLVSTTTDGERDQVTFNPALALIMEAANTISVSTTGANTSTNMTAYGYEVNA